ncbi:MAG: radical SAM protein [Flavobacteriaceae bacterium]
MGSFSGKQWKAGVRKSYMESNAHDGISLYIHLPFCESLCTFCGCHKRITKRHEMEAPYIRALLKEWDMYCGLFPGRPVVKELHIGGGTPTFFSPDNLKWLLEGIFRKARRAEGHEFSFEGHPNNTSAEHLEVLYDLGFTRASFGFQAYRPEDQRAKPPNQPSEQ